MKKKKINKLRRPYYVKDVFGNNDEKLVTKINELIDIVNAQQEIIDNLMEKETRDE